MLKTEDKESCVAWNHEIDDCWNRIGDRARQDVRCEQLRKVGLCRNCPIFIDAGRRLLDRPLSDEYRQQLNERYGSPPPSPKIHSGKSFIFRAGNEWLGINSSLIQEVVDMAPIHSIPHKSSRIFRGIVNIRGRLELCVSIGGVLRLEPGSKKYGYTSPERLIVVVKADQSVVFPVSEVLGQVQYDEEDIKPVPVTISGSKAVYTKGILTMDSKDIGLLDDDLLFRILTRNLE